MIHARDILSRQRLTTRLDVESGGTGFALIDVMDKIRSVLEWIVRRKYLSSFIGLLLLGGLLTVRYVAHASSGQMSDPIERGSITDAVYGIGTVTATNRISFNPMVGATLSQIFVREGDRVKKGMSLIRTDDGNIFKAPFDGVANYFPYHRGENALTSSPMLVVTDMANRYIVVNMEQQGAIRVKVGQTAKLSFDSLRKTTYEGKVAAVYSYANNFLARIDAVDLPDSILPDMTCDVAIVISVHENALLVPIAAFDNGHVWVKRANGLPHEIPVEIGVNDGNLIEVTKGDLESGDRVMIRQQVGI